MPRSTKSAPVTAFLIGLLGSATAAGAQAPAAEPKPTIVLVHGAFADSSSWDGVVAELSRDGYRVVAAANPLRSVSGDAAYVSALVRAIDGPVVLVGHSYGGTVITAAAAGNGNVKALVYVAGFQPDAGESIISLSTRFPSSLGDALAPPVALPGGGFDLYIRQDRFHAQFAADLPEGQAIQMAAEQRPVTQAAMGETSGEPAWRTIPSWSIYGSGDLNITPAAQAFMAERAGSRRTVVVRGASHLLMVSHPREVTAIVEEAAAAR